MSSLICCLLKKNHQRNQHSYQGQTCAVSWLSTVLSMLKVDLCFHLVTEDEVVGHIHPLGHTDDAVSLSPCKRTGYLAEEITALNGPLPRKTFGRRSGTSSSISKGCLTGLLKSQQDSELLKFGTKSILWRNLATLPACAVEFHARVTTCVRLYPPGQTVSGWPFFVSCLIGSVCLPSSRRDT